MPGEPIGPVVDISINPAGHILEQAFAGTLGVAPIQVEAGFGGQHIVGSTNALVPAGGIVSFPGTATGTYEGFACGLLEDPPLCTGPQVANITFDIPGQISLVYIFDQTTGLSIVGPMSFVGSVPEPSGALLSTLGLVLIGSALARRRAS